MMDLPTGFRQAYEMGLVSSAQLVNLLAMLDQPLPDLFQERFLKEFLGHLLAGNVSVCPRIIWNSFLELFIYNFLYFLRDCITTYVLNIFVNFLLHIIFFLINQVIHVKYLLNCSLSLPIPLSLSFWFLNNLRCVLNQ
ncbi:hypothetical protein Patl1_36974 [Pistacia atlantica]|nr:hypothetical protein Patl1_36974 [Pistacia atlantica]